MFWLVLWWAVMVITIGGKLPIMQGGVRLDSTLGIAAYLGTYMFFVFYYPLSFVGRLVHKIGVISI